MKRKGLSLQLAVAIDETLGVQHAISLPNAKRYVTREIMQKHRIRRSTKVVIADWLHALQVVLRYRILYFGTKNWNDQTHRIKQMKIICDYTTRLPSRSDPAQQPS